MPSLKTYDLFISHAWKYGDDYNRLVDLLDDANNFCYRNYSAPKDKPLGNLDGSDVTNKSEITSAIERKISPVNAVLIISGMYYNNRKWMQAEIDIALEKNKPIIAIKPWGNEVMPKEVSAAADTIVGWNTSSIVDAIRTYAL